MAKSGHRPLILACQLPSLAAWLMVLLLAFPTSFVSGSVIRLLGNQSEESCPQTVVEELKEEARLEISGWELVDGSGPAEHAIAAQERRGTLAFFRATATRPAELLARNGCGASLRC